MTRAYDEYGYDLTLSLIPGFILSDAPTFGSAIRELTVNFHFPTSGPPRKSLERAYAEYHANRLRLPKAVFKRNREKVEIDIASNLIVIDPSDWRQRIEHRKMSVALFRAGFGELVPALSMLRLKITPKDDFHLDAFLDYCQRREASLPSTDEGLVMLKNQVDERRAAVRAAKSPWESLGVEWRDFHPDARRILDDPFFWQGADDFSPHGNDTGADLLADYSSWLKQHRNDDPLDFYHHLTSGWGFALDTTDPTFRSVLDEAAVALAFAELKLRGDCRPSAAKFALQALERQRQDALAATDWPHRDDRLRRLDQIEAKLKAVC